MAVDLAVVARVFAARSAAVLEQARLRTADTQVTGQQAGVEAFHEGLQERNAGNQDAGVGIDES